MVLRRGPSVCLHVPTVTEDPRRQAHRLLDYLNGDVDSGIGLLYRVLRAAKAFSVDHGPQGPSGCIIGGGRSTPEGDSISEDDVLELCVRLKAWEMGVDAGDSTDKKTSLAQWLTAHSTEDHEHLQGLIERSRTKVEKLLAQELPTDGGIEDCLALAWYLKAWLGTHCEHSFRVAQHISHDIHEIACVRCDYTLVCAVGQFPLGRCEVCHGGLPPHRGTGRPRSTCSDACRQKLHRHKTRKG